jgi:uncharacterized protein
VKQLAKAVLALVAGLLFFIAPTDAAPQFPELTGRVVDNANLISPAMRVSLTQKLAALETRTGRQLVVVTLPSLGGYEIADYGYQLGRHWGIGQKGKNNGVLFIVAPNERKVRIEVGYGLEPILTDALSSVIIQSRVIPKFRDGDFEGGIVAGTDGIIEQLMLDAPAAKARVAEAERQQSDQGGGFNPIVLIFIGFFLFSIFGRMFGRRGSGLGALPFIFLGGGDRGGWGGGFGGGGGGFGGGGGSFGGGGSSGSW